jgi:REP element-mobilizing transposase RayT
MAVLTSQQRSQLEKAVKNARTAAEEGAFNALRALAVDHPEPFAHMTPEQRALRNNLRAKARLLGDELLENKTQNITHLAYELAYETWHKMLFARFLDANNLLMHPDGVAVTLQECEELAPEEGFADKWEAAAGYASLMLPAIFRTSDPLMQVPFSANNRIKLEEIIEGIDEHCFVADDALGWVYQFWQSEEKERINKSGDKIDGEKLPAVTQLFTEPYMVHFLIDNTVGAWWVSRNPGVKPPVNFEYLRVAPASSRSNNVAPASSRSNNVALASSRSNNVALASIRDSPASSQSNKNTPAGSRSYFAKYFNPYEEIENIKGNLPHWRQKGKMYFVTFRTADSMPQEKVKEWEEELQHWKKNNPEPLTITQKKEYYERFPAKMQKYLDAGYGACHLKKESIKIVVENALKHFDGERYKLDEYVVAANHVHALVQPIGEYELSGILHSWKSYTANIINEKTGERGKFWQKEYFDHLVRSEGSLKKFREYIGNHVNFSQDRGNTLKNLRQDDDDDNLRQDGGATFAGWPDKTAGITSLDPCMGSGHFVASLFSVFAPLRMYEEGLNREEAADKVITENLHGLEIDPRCTQIAAFNLALTAWKFCGYYKELPEMNLACSGIAPKGKVEDWVKLVSKVEDETDRYRMENGMRALYEHFQLAPELGSLLDPTTIKPDAFTASFEQLQPALQKALENESSTELVERGVMAAGIAKAGMLLSKKYTLQITNVPYLGRGRQVEKGIIQNYCTNNYPDEKGDLANVFFEKMLKSNTAGGTACTVMPQNWLFLTTYKKLREKLLKNETWNFVARLGPGAFSQITGEVVKAILISISHQKPHPENEFIGLDVSEKNNAAEKDEALKIAELKIVKQKEQLENPDAIISIEHLESISLLGKYANSLAGIDTGDANRFKFKFYELPEIFSDWILQLNSFEETSEFSGREHILYWQDGKGELLNVPGARIQNVKYWNRKGIYVVRMAKTPATISYGEAWDRNGAMIIPHQEEHLLPLWEYSKTAIFRNNLRKLNQKLSISEATFPRIGFDLEHWQKVAAEKYPNGLPKPYSDDPTQWLFHGHPVKAENPLQVAVARLLGYRWPAEVNAASISVNNANPASGSVNNNAAGSGIYVSEEARELIAAIKNHDHHTDDDGILCIPPVNTETAGADRLRDYLQEVFADEWSTHTQQQLFDKEGAKSTNLETWLRDEFFARHCKVFKNRPFIWHIWDGRKDGFSALVNYHKLDKDNLSKLIYTYLNDWIRMCEAKKRDGESGAEGLLSAAIQLKAKLELILEGEAPYDIFVRWKPLEQQPIGWEPDLNDGVRLNIRPFVEAGVLRKKFNVKWGTDRGKNPPGSPWGEIRDNDKHLSLEEKRAAREK